MPAYRALLRGNPPCEPRCRLFAIARNAKRLRFRHGRVTEAEPDEDMPLSRDESLVWQLVRRLPSCRRASARRSSSQEVGGPSYAEISSVSA